MIAIIFLAAAIVFLTLFFLSIEEKSTVRAVLSGLTALFCLIEFFSRIQS